MVWSEEKIIYLGFAAFYEKTPKIAGCPLNDYVWILWFVRFVF